MRKPYVCILMLVCFCVGCQSPMEKPLKYLALGDSYTIGESVSPEMRWPVQWADELKTKAIVVSEPQIIAKSGWTTDELLASLDSATLDPPYDMLSLLIGVNNQYRGRDVQSFREDLDRLIGLSMTLVYGKKERIFMLSIPDWGVTPFAAKQNRDPGQIAREIDVYNEAKKDLASDWGIPFIDITEISREAARDSSLLAEDGLHPSGKMYRAWVQKALPEIMENFSE